MDTLTSIFNAIESLGIHRGGWIFVAALAVIPALVGGNMLIFYLDKVLKREVSLRAAWRPLLANFLVALISASVIGTAIYVYL